MNSAAVVSDTTKNSNRNYVEEGLLYGRNVNAVDYKVCC